MELFLFQIISFVSSVTALNCETPRHLTGNVPGRTAYTPPIVSDISVSSLFFPYYREDIFAYRYPFHSSYCWCSGGQSVPQFITVNFTEPIVLDSFLSGGCRGEYINTFSFNYSEVDGGVITVGDLPKVFNVDNEDTVSYFSLPQPIIAKTIYFHAQEYEGWPCWTLALFGCTLNEVTEGRGTIAIKTISPTASPSPICPSMREDIKAESGVQEESTSSSSLAIATSTSVVTIVIVLILVIVGVILCWAISRGHISHQRKNNRLNSYRLQNEEGTLRRVENELYTLSKSEETQRESTSSGNGLLDSDNSNIQTTPTNKESQEPYELVQALDDENNDVLAESLVDNPAYLPVNEDNSVILNGRNTGYEPVIPQD